LHAIDLRGLRAGISFHGGAVRVQQISLACAFELVP
jgi:hypothetical protein